VKIKHKSLRVEDADWDVTDEEAAAVKAEMFLDPKNNYNSKEEWAEITGKVEEEGRRCPECGSPLVHAAVSTTVSEGGPNVRSEQDEAVYCLLRCCLPKMRLSLRTVNKKSASII
jgi:hypothetical protein